MIRVPQAVLLSVLPAVVGCGVGDEADRAVGVRQQAVFGGEPEPGLPAIGVLRARGHHLCTATLVAPQQVLTAAHCFGHQDLTGLVVRFEVDATTTVEVPVAEYLVHPQYHHDSSYTPRTKRFDVAVVQLVRPVLEIAPLGLSPAANAAALRGSAIRAVGYGYTDAQRPSGVKHATTFLVSEVQPLQFSVRFGESSICWGDSGGPAISAAGEIVGIASHYAQPLLEDPRPCGQLQGLHGWWVRADAARPFMAAAQSSLQELADRGTLLLADGSGRSRNSLRSTSVEVPVSTTRLTVALATRGELHLALRHASAPPVLLLETGPALGVADCRSELGPDREQLCTIVDPAPGRWHVAILAVTDGSYDLRAWAQVVADHGGKADGEAGGEAGTPGCALAGRPDPAGALIVLGLWLVCRATRRRS